MATQPRRRALWQERRQALQQHLSTAQGAAPGGHDGGWRRFLRRTLMLLVHPAAWLFHRAPNLGDRKIEPLLQTRRARRLWMFSEDDVQLDGLLLQPRSPACAKPAVLIIVVGFAMTYETVVHEAQGLADKFGMQVLLFNSRGIGKSLGSSTSIDETIYDCRAAILLAQRLAPRVGVYGVSLGAATSLFALQGLQAEGLLAQPLALYASIRGFASLLAVVRAYLGPRGQALVAAALQAATLHPLDSLSALSRRLAAETIMVASAAADGLIPPAAQLAAQLGLDDEGLGQLPSGQTVTYVAGLGQGHNDRCLAHPLHDAVLSRFAGGGAQ